ncbi:MAG: GTPase ObgE [Candidatus Bathyarchaeota archaeon]|jgi:GTP-binding protein|nr:GTPase ObgE [Candidatus Bathyarchaeota archaeon]
MIDTARITVIAGSGGSGCVSFRREKYVPRGGPDGGDGGRGGHVVLQVGVGLHMLRAFRYKRSFKAEDGGRGRGRNKAGRSGKDCIVEVPKGTVITRVEEDGRREVINDLKEAGVSAIVGKGGSGGKGNARFKRPENRVPLIAEDGEIGETVTLELELKVLADVAIIGMPSVGKSSLLRASSRARPDVAEYPFTTLEPVLGVVQRKRKEFVLAEIPGLIEGAHRGAGLGYEFLRHLQRVSGILHVLDGTSETIVKDYFQVHEEVRRYDERTWDKPELVVVNKMDVAEEQRKRSDIEGALLGRGIQVQFISAATGDGVGEVLDKLLEILETLPLIQGTQDEPARILKPRQETNKVSIEKDHEVFIVRSARAERIVSRVDLEDWSVQAQLWGELQRIGVSRALERAGAKSGARVRIGDTEMEWK